MTYKLLQPEKKSNKIANTFLIYLYIVNQMKENQPDLEVRFVIDSSRDNLDMIKAQKHRNVNKKTEFSSMLSSIDN